MLKNLPYKLQAYAHKLSNLHYISAFYLALWHHGLLYQAASGILNLDTDIDAGSAHYSVYGS